MSDTQFRICPIHGGYKLQYPDYGCPLCYEDDLNRIDVEEKP